MLMRHHLQQSPDYYSSLAASAGVTSPSLSLGIISSSLEKMPLELRLRTAGRDEDDRVGALDEELSPKTECSEDSVEIRSTPMRIHRPSLHHHHQKTQIILRPNAVLAASPLKRLSNNNNSSSRNCPNKMSNWMDSEQPDEKRMRLMGHPALPLPPPPLTHFYHPASVQHENVLKLTGGSQQLPHDLLLLEAERNRLFHHWMRPNNWPIPPVPSPVHHPSMESSAAHHLMTSALHYHYPHLLQQQQQQQGNYNLPPHPFLHSSPGAASAAAIFNLSYGHLLPHPIFHHHRPAFYSPTSSAGVKTIPPLSPVCARSLTPPPPPPPSILGPLPPLVPVDGPQSPRHLAPPPPPPPSTDFNQKKVPFMPNASGQSIFPLKTSSMTMKKKMKKSPIHPAGRSSGSGGGSSRQTRKIGSLNVSGCDGKFSVAKNGGGVVSALPLFLSVESLLSREKPTEKVRPEEELRNAESEEEEPEEEDEEEEDEIIQWRHSQPLGPSRATTANSHRNYKNMTRERRMQANARERTRVHTISSAFEALRRAVPSFSHGQRLSKLSILRVASAYIAALGQLAGDEPEEKESSPRITRDEGNHQTTTTTTTGRRQLAECVDRCTRTLMTEGQLLRRNRKRSGVANGRQTNATDDEDD